MNFGKNLLAATLLLASSFNSFAGNIGEDERTSKASVTVHQNGEFAYVRCAEVQKPVQISIRNSQGQVIFQEKISKTESFIRPYNLTQLAKGAYTLEVKGETTVTSNIVIGESSTTSTLPVFIKYGILESNTMKVIVNNVTEPSILNVYDRMGSVVYTTEINDSFASKLIFEGTDVANYTCEVVKK
jgi:hypothetical protein